MSDLEEIVYKHALINAVKHKGKASNGAVMGSVMATHAELRTEAKKIAQLAAQIVVNVNSMDPVLQKSELDKFGGMKEKKTVEFKVIEKTGQGYQKQYMVSVFYDDKQIATGYGFSIKEAEQNGAANACGELSKLSQPES